jgi:hypothetical protein
MAIGHLPRPSAETTRKFFFEITTIIIGILIALWIDGIKDTRRDQALVRSADALLAREIADNLRDIESTQPSRDAHAKALRDGLQMIEDLLARGATAKTKPVLALNSPSFPRSAWDSASRTGALALMDYASVKRYAEVYDLQDLVDATQQRYVQRLTEQSAQLFLVMESPAGMTMRPADVEAARVQAMSLLGAFETYQELAKQLASRYKSAPKL